MSSRPPRLKPGGAQRSYATGTQGRIAPGSNEKLVTCTVHYSDHVITGPRGLLVLSYLFLKHVAANLCMAYIIQKFKHTDNSSLG